MLTLTVTISDADELALKNDLLDIDQWFQDAAKGKINSCKKRMVAAGVQNLMKDPTVTSIPANQDALIALIVSRPGYLDRAAREVEAKAIEDARREAMRETKST